MESGEYEEAIFDYYNLTAGTHWGHYMPHANRHHLDMLVEERKQRGYRLIIEGIAVIDDQVPSNISYPLSRLAGIFRPFFIPAGEMERIWRASADLSKWRVAARYFIWVWEGDGPQALEDEGFQKRLLAEARAERAEE